MTRLRTDPQRSLGLATLTWILILTDGALAARSVCWSSTRGATAT
jgi:hypothetical protein